MKLLRNDNTIKSKKDIEEDGNCQLPTNLIKIPLLISLKQIIYSSRKKRALESNLTVDYLSNPY